MTSHKTSHTTDHKPQNVDENISQGVHVDDTKVEIIDDKLENNEIFREDDQEAMRNPNDASGFADGVQDGWDGEDRQGDPNSLTGSDLSGEERGGAGTGSGGGVDGGPQRR